MEDVRLTLAQQIKDSSAVISTEIGFSEIFFVRRKLRSIIYNLVNNSIKYCSKQRTPIISIATKQIDDFTDNGMGISTEDHANIFSKYQRVSQDGEGSGIGLYLVKEIVTASGGRIEVESELGKGSTFSVFLKVTE
ncbi:Alkaline phosphatase synthesis sensor protein PhoR [compost metagenome]